MTSVGPAGGIPTVFTPSFRFTAEQDEFRSRVRGILHSQHIRDDITASRTSQPMGHPEGAYRALGERGYLAPEWPAQYGGMGTSIVFSAIVAEEMSLAGVPDSVRINTIDNAGSTLLASGTDAQKAAYLPGMAAGTSQAVVLFSEPEAGSDLASLATRAEHEGGSWRLTGEKIWNVGAAQADFGICLARTGDGSSKYAGLSLFLVPLRADGVRVSRIPGINPEEFGRIGFDGTVLPPDSLVGLAGNGWSLANRALTIERTGIYFYGRAQRWLDLLAESGPPASWHDTIDDLRAELTAARLLTWRCVELLASGQDAAGVAAAAKWWTADLATRVARLAWRNRDHIRNGAPGTPGDRPGDGVTASGELLTARYEAPGLTVAGGTSEMMLAAVSALLLDDDALEVAW
jgi:alkylation response protein AidB-like acyl-CoA dehydrogenase